MPDRSPVDPRVAVELASREHRAPPPFEYDEAHPDADPLAHVTVAADTTVCYPEDLHSPACFKGYEDETCEGCRSEARHVA